MGQAFSELSPTPLLAKMGVSLWRGAHFQEKKKVEAKKACPITFCPLLARNAKRTISCPTDS